MDDGSRQASVVNRLRNSGITSTKGVNASMQYRSTGLSRRLTAFCVVMFVLLFFAAPSAVLAAPFTQAISSSTGWARVRVALSTPVIPSSWTSTRLVGPLSSRLPCRPQPAVLRSNWWPVVLQLQRVCSTRSTDGRLFILTGYAATLGGSTSLGSTASATINRLVGRVDTTGNIDTSTALTDFASGNNPRSAVSTDGTTIWATGGAGGARYTTLGSTTSTQVSTTTTNLRQVNIFNGQLYVSSSSQ